MPTSLEILQTRLTEAETAYHELMTGQSVRVLVDQNGERVEYTSANAYRLATYIAELKRRIATLQGGTTGRPMRIYL